MSLVREPQANTNRRDRMKGPWKALVFLAAVAGTAFVLSTSAFAQGGGSRPAPAQWKTTLGAAVWSGKLKALYPGAANDTELRTITVTNMGRVIERLGTVTVSLRTTPNGDARNSEGAGIPGCQASWFELSVEHGNHSLPAQIAPGDAYTAKVAFSMRDTSSNQDACRSSSPAFTVTAAW
jgi:hypothetical protein